MAQSNRAGTDPKLTFHNISNLLKKNAMLAGESISSAMVLRLKDSGANVKFIACSGNHC
jgi:hypothetical protein